MLPGDTISLYDINKAAHPIVARYNLRDMPRITQADYESLGELRYQIRRFLHFSEQTARAAGLEPQQHQLMLALKGLPSGLRPRVGELAERLQIRHHSTVELVNRLVAGGFVHRTPCGRDRREVLLSLTTKGERVLRELSTHHLSELRLRGPALVEALKRATRGRIRSRRVRQGESP
jgi:DNA-binding MarR family transcriptional regulator